MSEFPIFEFYRIILFQGLADCSLPEPECVIRVLKTGEGKRYLDDLIRIYPKCSAQVSTSCVLCAATGEDELQAFVKELERNLVKKVLQVRTKFTSQSLPSLLSLSLLSPFSR